MRNEFDGIVIQDDQSVDEPVSCHNLRVTGTAGFMSAVDADFADISGEVCFDADVTCDKLTVRGRCVCKCALLSSSVRVFGGMAVYGRFYAETVVINGAFKFRSAFRAASLSVKSDGYVKGSAKLRVSRCIINGAVVNSGVLSADTVSIMSGRPSRIQEIRCESIRAEAQEGFSSDAPSYDNDMYDTGGSDSFTGVSDKYLLTSDFVDCYTADIESCRIGTLFCDSAVIRKGCVIHEILYRDSIEIEQGARVERLSKT